MKLDLSLASCPWNNTGEKPAPAESWQILDLGGDGMARSQGDESAIMCRIGMSSWMASFCTIMVNVDLLMKGINMHLSLVHNWGCWPQFFLTSLVVYQVQHLPNASLHGPNPSAFTKLLLKICEGLKLKVGKIDMQVDVTLDPHPSASSNGEKEVQPSGRVNVFTSTLLMWVSSNVTTSAPDDPKLIPKWWRSKCSLLIIPNAPSLFSDIFLDLCDLFPKPVTARWNCFFLQHFVFKQVLVFMVFCCFWREKRLVVFKKGDSSFLFVNSLHLPLYWQGFGPSVWDWGSEREETMLGICDKRKEKPWVIPTCQTQAELSLFPNKFE